jgi:hypothetical protein
MVKILFDQAAAAAIFHFMYQDGKREREERGRYR